MSIIQHKVLPFTTTENYLKSLTDKEIKTIYESSFWKDVNAPDLMEKIKAEMELRQIPFAQIIEP